METIKGLKIENNKPKAVAVGFFDGVHLGHQAVIKKALEFKSQGLESCVFSFATTGDSPTAKKGAGLLQSFSLKGRALEKMGVDYLLLPDFSQFMGMTPQQFAEDVLVKGIGAKVVCCGYDYRFGKGAAAGAKELAALLAPFGVEVLQVDAVMDNGSPISSTRIRAALAQGDIAEANRLLGREFTVDFTVTHGKGLGRNIGFPTANQPIPEKFIKPKFGVYATKVIIDGKTYAGATNVGVNPTVGDNAVAVETHVIDYKGDLYDKTVETKFLQFLRPEQKFSSIDELKAQIAIDTARTKEIVKL